MTIFLFIYFIKTLHKTDAETRNQKKSNTQTVRYNFIDRILL